MTLGDVTFVQILDVLDCEISINNCLQFCFARTCQSVYVLMLEIFIGNQHLGLSDHGKMITPSAFSEA